MRDAVALGHLHPLARAVILPPRQTGSELSVVPSAASGSVPSCFLWSPSHTTSFQTSYHPSCTTAPFPFLCH